MFSTVFSTGNLFFSYIYQQMNQLATIMKRTVLLVMLLAAWCAAAQQRNPVVPSFTGAVEDFKPNVTNQRGHQYPMVNSQGAVRAQLRAPQAQAVQLDIAGKRYEMTKDENGVWTGTSDPQVPAASTSSAPAAGAAVSRSLPPTWISGRSRTCPKG